ncbi:glutamine amidotransferase [Nitrobacter vulgaris]|uniref:class II glutamine amidotransferase n=1 Tax=Nitrobacter vulgaris TaxID=29421 RepID=UPI00285EF4F1|nr:class II glutamine amidotransferase [Nitrobacter vulgaris]MDR6306750.1 glutamine amidotransferase [Nitrobacter vulgaris]
MSGLFGLISGVPSDPGTSFALLKPHGEDLYGYADGWGIAIFDGKAARLFKEKRAFARTSYLSPFNGEAFRSSLAIAHINKTENSTNPITIADIQPFERELGGRSWVFAHDGDLPGQLPFDTHTCRPIGRTPSERAFCALLMSADTSSEQEYGATDLEHLTGALSRQISRTNELGVFNILMSDGELLFVHTHTVLYQLERRVADDEACSAMTMISSYPVTDDDDWQPLPSNSLTVFRGGQQIAQTETQGKAPSEAWERQRREADLVKGRHFEIEQWVRRHNEQFGDGMNYESG